MPYCSIVKAFDNVNNRRRALAAQAAAGLDEAVAEPNLS